MNVLLTCTSYPPAVGGAQLLVHQLARQMVSRHGVQVVAQWDSNRTDWLLGTTLRAPAEPKAYQLDGVPVQCITLSAAARRRLLPWVLGYYVLEGPALARIAAMLVDELAPWSASADVIHNTRVGREGLSYASFRLARRRGVPFVLTPLHHPRWGGWLHRHYHALYRAADALIALTEAERRTLIELGANERHVHVTGTGPVLAKASDGGRFRAQYHLADHPLVLFLGQMYAYKGMEALLGAAHVVWRRFPEARFAFLGPDTPYSTKLFAGVSDPRVLVLGRVSLQDKTDALAACEVFCLPSTQESFGGVYTEAWSLGKPVIGCDIPAVRTVVDDGQDGLLTPQRAGDIAERIVYLLERPEERERMGRCGQRKVEKRYSWPRLAELTLQAYQKALKA